MLWPKHYTPPKMYRLRGGDVIRAVAADFGLDPSEITGPCREPHLVDARAAVVAILRSRNMSYTRIGQMLGGRKHTSIMHLDRQIDQFVQRNRMVRISVERHTPAK